MNDILFSTTGIRGAANVKLTPEYCVMVAQSIAAWKKRTIERPMAIVAIDTRRSSPMLATAIVSGLLSAGVDVTYVERPIPTPQLVFETVTQGYDLGIVITGSHLPASDNGIILIDSDGGYYKGTLPVVGAKVSWDKLGRLKKIDNHWEHEFTLRYRNHLLQQVNGIKLQGRVLMDSVHGPMRPYMFEILSAVFDEVITVNHQDDDTISGRPSEPKESTLGETKEILLKSNAVMGVATDLDGDRVIFITQRGRVVSGDLTGAIFTLDRWEREPKKPVVVPVNTSAIISDLAEKTGNRYVYTNVGAPSIIEKMREIDAHFGFEETGKYFFSPNSLYPDSAFSTAQLLQILHKKEKSLDELVEELPQYYAMKTKVPSVRETSKERFKRIVESLNDLYTSLPDGYSVIQVEDFDGLRIDLTNNAWILIRQSGTEDNLRIFTESKDQSMTRKLNEIATEFVSQFLD